MFTIWNEPNWPGFMSPQWVRAGGVWVPHSADMYRAMVQAAYPAIKSAAPGSRVLIGGTASIGSSTPGQRGVPPLWFLRRLACVDVHLRPVSSGACAGFKPLPGDGWAHHPYSLHTLPDAVSSNTDMLPVAATPRLIATLRRLVAEGRLAPADANVYMTEYGYTTNPPDPQAPFSLAQQPRLLAWAEYLGTRDPAVKMWPQFLLRDRPNGPAGPQMRLFGDWHTGLFFNDGTPKPAAATFRFPAFAACEVVHGRRWTLVWSRMRGAPSGIASEVQVAGSARAAGAGRAWRTLRSAPTPGVRALTSRAIDSGGEVMRWVPWSRGLTYRVSWGVGASASQTSLEVNALACPRAQKWVPRNAVSHRPLRAIGKGGR
jgi:hypothetical protein